MLGFTDIKSLSCDELEEFLKSKEFKPEIYEILKGIVHCKELVKPGVLQVQASVFLEIAFISDVNICVYLPLRALMA